MQAASSKSSVYSTTKKSALSSDKELGVTSFPARSSESPNLSHRSNTAPTFLPRRMPTVSYSPPTLPTLSTPIILTNIWQTTPRTWISVSLSKPMLTVTPPPTVSAPPCSKPSPTNAIPSSKSFRSGMIRGREARWGRRFRQAWALERWMPGYRSYRCIPFALQREAWIRDWAWSYSKGFLIISRKLMRSLLDRGKQSLHFSLHSYTPLVQKLSFNWWICSLFPLHTPHYNPFLSCWGGHQGVKKVTV